MFPYQYGYWEEWELREKVEFDGATRRIIVHPEVTTLNIRSEVYSAWVRWGSRHDNSKWFQAMRYSGFDVIPGGEGGGSFFLINNWKLIIDFNKVAVEGVLYSDNFETAYWSENNQPLYPAKVSSVVNSVVSYQNVVTGTALTPEQTAAAVWGAMTRTLTTPIPTAEDNAAATWGAAEAMQLIARQAIMEKILRNKTVTDPVTGQMVVYDDDGSTILFSCNLWENTQATQQYRGQGSDRRDRLA